MGRVSSGELTATSVTGGVGVLCGRTPGVAPKDVPLDGPGVNGFLLDLFTKRKTDGVWGN